MVLVKADLHIHTSEEREDTYISYSAKSIIDVAAEKGINVVAITLHNVVFPINSLKKYAKKKGILVIQGVEAKIEGKHVLIYNISPVEFSKIKSFNDLRLLRKKNKNIFVIAPHPFVPKNFLTRTCVQDRYFENKDLFDALEIQQFAFSLFNPNRKTTRIALQDNKALVANSDCHFLKFFGKHYTIVDVKGTLNENSFFTALKNRRTKLVVNNNFTDTFRIFLSFFFK